MIFRKKCIQFFYLIVLLTACAADKSNTSLNIQGYDYARMKKAGLEKPLREISGIAHHSGIGSFVAINDEKGIVYVLDTENFRITDTYKFGEEGDYEEIQVMGNVIYVLRSDGTIYKMKLNGIDMPHIETFEYVGTKAEYESFYIDAAANTLVLIPKQSKSGTQERQTVSYTIHNSNGSYAQKKECRLAWSDLKSSSTLHPSGVAIHPVSKNIYLLVSIEKKLIVMDPSWHVLEEYELDRTNFQQPEGITFDTAGNLYITNEGGDGIPTIIQIPVSSN